MQAVFFSGYDWKYEFIYCIITIRTDIKYIALKKILTLYPIISEVLIQKLLNLLRKEVDSTI